MAKKEKEHNHNHFIPSPYGVVTAYENAFIKEFNNNLSGAIAEVLKYIAHLTATDIKNSKEKNNE